MSNIIRWEPMREMMTLREAMDRLFDDAFTRPISASGFSGMPAIDLYQDDDEVVVKASLPGLRSEDVQISVTNGVLTLRGEFKQDEEKKEKPTISVNNALVHSSARSPCRPMSRLTNPKQILKMAS